jgi:EmrB/QacA subfamily drug resistance transporter
MKNMEYKWKALSCTSLGALFSVLSGSTLVIALPAIMKDLHASMDSIVWTLMIYMLVITILVPAIGRVADMIGRKKLYIGGLAVFTVGSALCGISQTGWQLVWFRLVQAVGGALMVGNSTAIVADAFPKKELGRALGINGMVISVASVIGPILGGAFINIGWRYIFYINIPVGIIGIIWSALQLEELDVLPEKQKFDWGGTATFTLGMTLLLMSLTVGSFFGWANPLVWAFAVIAVLSLALFVFIENRVSQPMLDLGLFKTRILAFAFTSNLLNGIARGAVTFLLVFFFQGIRAIDPVMSGILLAPFAVSMMVMAPISGILSDKYGSRGLSSLGLLISALGLLGMVFITKDTSVLELCVWMFIAGLGSGMFFSPNTNAIMGAVPVERRGIAAGVRTMMNNAGSVISLALAMAIISSSIDPAAMQALFTGTQVGSQGIAVGDFIAGLRVAFGISFGISLIAALISYMRGPQPQWSAPAVD